MMAKYFQVCIAKLFAMIYWSNKKLFEILFEQINNWPA